MFERIERGTSAELFHGLNGKTNGIRGGFTVRMSNSCDLGWPPSFTDFSLFCRSSHNLVGLPSRSDFP